MGRRDDTDIDGLVADLAERELRDWTRRVQAGDERAQMDMQTVVIDRLIEPDVRELFAHAVTDPRAAGDAFAKLVIEAMRDQCEAHVEDDLARSARAAADERAEQQIDMARDRAAHLAETP